MRQLRITLIKRTATAVHGIGEIGKTALANEYANAYAREYPSGLFQLPCEGAHDLKRLLIVHAHDFGVALTDAEQRNADAAFAHVRAALEAGEPKLLVLDKVDNADLLSRYARAQHLPRGASVHVLATTRLEPAKLPDLACLTLGALSDDECVDLLDRWRPLADEADRASARAIGRRLGGHALAIETVGAYLARRRPRAGQRLPPPRLNRRVPRPSGDCSGVVGQGRRHRPDRRRDPRA